jgi:conjugal transfer pilus assembly protein TraD
MPSSSEIPEQQASPLTPLGELLHGVTSSLLHIIIGVAIGLIAARLMRNKHLHWSWAAISLALVGLERGLLGVLTLPLASAALWASLRGRRWHHQDLQAGGDLAEIATLRRSPLDVLGSLVLLALQTARSAISMDARPRGGQLILGRDERGRSVSIPFGDVDAGRHTLVLGATGSGKTVTQTFMAKNAVARGMGVIVLDPKGDEAMREQLRRAAAEAGREFLEWAPKGELVYNPFASGGETEIADKALAGERFTEPHYLRQAQRYLGHVVRLLRSSGVEISLRRIVELLEPGRLEHLARDLEESDSGRVFAYLDSLSARQRADLSGVRDRLAILVESDVGRWLDPQSTGAGSLDLPRAVRARSTVYFSLESDTRPLLAQMLGAAIVQDLQTTVAALQGGPIATMVVIDEFSAVAAEQVVRLFGRARSAGFSLLLGTQELSDLRLPGHERMLEQVMGNLTVLIAHRQVVPGSAELIAGVAGTRGSWRVSSQSDGRTSRTRTRERILDPSRIAGLAQGWAAVIVPGAPEGPRITRVFSR